MERIIHQIQKDISIERGFRDWLSLVETYSQYDIDKLLHSIDEAMNRYAQQFPTKQKED